MELQITDLLAILEHYCNPDLPVLGESQSQLLVGLELPAVIQANGLNVPQFMYRPTFSHLFRMRARGQQDKTDHGSFSKQSEWNSDSINAASEDAAAEVVTSWLVCKLSILLSLPDTGISPSQAISEHGIDSLSAVDLKNSFRQDPRLEVELFDLMASSSLDSWEREMA